VKTTYDSIIWGQGW